MKLKGLIWIMPSKLKLHGPKPFLELTRDIFVMENNALNDDIKNHSFIRFFISQLKQSNKCITNSLRIRDTSHSPCTHFTFSKIFHPIYFLLYNQKGCHRVRTLLSFPKPQGVFYFELVLRSMVRLLSKMSTTGHHCPPLNPTEWKSIKKKAIQLSSSCEASNKNE